MHVDLRRLRQPHHAVGVEVALHRGAVLDGDLAVERSAQPEDYGAFGLLGNRQRIDHVAGIERDSDAIDLHVAVRLDGHLADLRAEAVGILADGDATTAPARQRLAPVPLPGGRVPPPQPFGLPSPQLPPPLRGPQPPPRPPPPPPTP